MTDKSSATGYGGRPTLYDNPLVIDRVKQIIAEAGGANLSVTEMVRRYNEHDWPAPHATISHGPVSKLMHAIAAEEHTAPPQALRTSLKFNPLIRKRIKQILETTGTAISAHQLAQRYNKMRWPEPDHQTVSHVTLGPIMRSVIEEMTGAPAPPQKGGMIPMADRPEVKGEVRNILETGSTGLNISAIMREYNRRNKSPELPQTLSLPTVRLVVNRIFQEQLETTAAKTKRKSTGTTVQTPGFC